MHDGLLKLKTLFEEALEKKDELVLSSFRWNLDSSDALIDLKDPFLGLTDDFKHLIGKVCRSPQEWLLLYVELLQELAKEDGEYRNSLLRLSEGLWMQTYYGDLCIWHKAFPPLDGGGSSQARAFLNLFEQRFPKRRFKTLFEWCCGPGFLGFSFLQKGICEELVLADINPHVVPGIERTIAESGLTGRVRYYISDNLKNVPKEESFDLVLGNPPWAYREIPGLPNPLIPNDPGWAIHKAFFQQIGEFLTPDAVLCISTHEPFKTISYIEEQEDPWDIRPVPPIENFREFARQGGLTLSLICKPASEPQIAMVKGMTFLLFTPSRHRLELRPDLDLVGLGGAQEASERFELELNLFQTVDLKAALNSCHQFEALKFGLYRFLENNHLTRGLSKIFGDRERFAPEVMSRLGVPPEICLAFSDWEKPDSFSYTGPSEGFRLAEESARSEVQQVRLQLTQDAPICLGLRVVRDLMQVLGGEIDFCLTVKPGFEESSTRRLLEQFEGYRKEGVTFFEHGHQTLFAQDNARLGYLPSGDRALLVPGALSPHRPSDVLYSAPLPILSSRLHWEGGNLLFDGHRLCIGANSVAQTMRHYGLTFDQALEAFATECGGRPLVLGSVEASLQKIADGERGLKTSHAVDGGQADFHIDLDVCLLGAPGVGEPPVAALADPEAGFNYLQDILDCSDLFQGHFFSPAEAREHFCRNLENSVARRSDLLTGYERSLRNNGYKVARIPDIRLVSDFNYLARVNLNFGYLNALSLRRGKAPTVCLLPLGLERLEKEVERLYGLQGVSVAWIGEAHSSRELASMRGGLHCLCSVLK